MNKLMSLEEIRKLDLGLDVGDVGYQRRGKFDELFSTASAAHEWKTDAEKLAQCVRDANEACNELEKENAKLRHDIERHIEIAAGLATENESLKRAINPDGSLTEFQDFMELAQDLRHAFEVEVEMIEEADRLKRDLAKLRDQLLVAMAKSREDYLLNGVRFKLSFSTNGNVECFCNYAKELNGRWVALVAAEDDCHIRAIGDAE